MTNRIFKIAAHGLLKKGSRYLVTRRSARNDYMPGYWDVPGGTIEFGEKTFEALKREFREETNLKITPGKVLFAYGYRSNPKRHQFQLVFSCRYKSGKVRLNPVEHDVYQWVTLKELGRLKKIAFLGALYRELKNQ
jgi:8-oxo-dGTP diphosphatase